MLTNNRGFTLIEVIITIVIFGILAGIAGPMTAWTPEKALKSTSRQIWSNIHYTRRKAVSSGSRYVMQLVTLDTGKKQIQIWKDCNCGTFCAIDSEDQFSSSIDLYDEITNVQFTPSPPATLCFMPNGSIPGTNTITSTNKNSQTQVVTIIPSTGASTIGPIS